MSYSREEIERKRQEALKKKLSKNITISNNNSLRANPLTNYTTNSHNNSMQSNSIFNYTSKSSNSSKFANGISNFINQNSAQSINANKLSPQSNFQGKTQTFSKTQLSANRHNPLGKIKNFYSDKAKKCEIDCSLINATSFCAETSMYDAALIELFKTIPTKKYDPQTKVWNFHITNYDVFREKVKGSRPDVDFRELPKFVQHEFKKLSKDSISKQDIDLSSIDSKLIESLYPFQKEGIEYGISKNGRCMIADDMGLGKTRQALGIAHYYKNDWPLLIVSPSSVRYQWSEAILDNLPSVPAQYIQHIRTKSDYIEKLPITIVSYDVLTRRIDELSARKFGVMICDESHYLKSAKTKRTESVTRIASKVQRLILLSGTPALSRPMELHPQIKMLIPTFMNWMEFGLRYCSGVKTSYGFDFTGSSNTKELEIILRSCCLIRRLKKDVMTQLPSKIRQKIILDPSLIKAETKKIEKARKEFEKDSKGSKTTQAMFEYYRETSQAKQVAVCNYISELIENDQKFIVFAHHQEMIDAICEVLRKHKKIFVRIDGKTNPEARKHCVDEFQNKDVVLAAVLSIKACYAGITLTAAQLVIFAELDWNPSILCQAEDRAHRIGQTENVSIRYLLAKNTADDRMWINLQSKTDVLNAVGLDQNFDLDKADITNQPAILSNQLQLEFSNSSSQQKLDSFFETSSLSATPASSSIDASGNAELQTSSDSLKDLLDVDDDAFDSIDLDNIA